MGITAYKVQNVVFFVYLESAIIASNALTELSMSIAQFHISIEMCRVHIEKAMIGCV